MRGRNPQCFFSKTEKIRAVGCPAMRRAGLSQEERVAFQAEATVGHYKHLLATCVEWFEVDQE